MRRAAVACLFVLVLAGCAGGEDPAYDTAALRQARLTARTVSAWPGWGRPISVGRPTERKLCEAQTYHAEPCVAVPTLHRVRKLDIHGEMFVWLEREHGRWSVVDTDYVTPDITVTIERGQPGPPLFSP